MDREQPFNREQGTVTFEVFKQRARNLEEPIQEVPSNEFIGDVVDVSEESHFIDGSKYKGTWDALGMAGVGRFVMPHGVVFEGEFRDGMFHGHGTLQWPRGQRVDGVWSRGRLQKKRYVFSDGLVYDESDWNYCQFPDRRFFHCINEGLKPAGATSISNARPAKAIPFHCYDTGDGLFDPSTLCVMSFHPPHKVLRIPTKSEALWIMKNCRRGSTQPTGYQSRLNENWSKDPPKLPYCLPLSKDSPENWWNRLSTFERDIEALFPEKESPTEEEEEAPKPFDETESPCPCFPVPAPSKEDIHEDPLDEKSATEEANQLFQKIVCSSMDKFQEADVWKLLKTICVPRKDSSDADCWTPEEDEEEKDTKSIWSND